jgi:hypothetical protein
MDLLSEFENEYNGREDIISQKSNIKFINDAEQYSENGNNIISRTNAQTRVSELYFSNGNVNMLQQGIINKIYNITNGVYLIGKQSDSELKIIMRSIYYQYSKNNPEKIIEQVKELNTKVLDWAIPEILSNIKQHEHYKKDVSTLAYPNERPIFISQKGTKSNELWKNNI